MNFAGMKASPEWWLTVLDHISGLIVRKPGLQEMRQRLPTDAIERGRLIHEGASPAELDALEERLGRPFSASYRALLQASNGFPALGLEVGRLLPAEEVDWFPKRHPEQATQIQNYLKQDNANRRPFADAKWTVDIPIHSIEITEPLNGATVLLHPRRGRGGGEWDAWLVQPNSATRFPTIADFAESQIRSLDKA